MKKLNKKQQAKLHSNNIHKTGPHKGLPIKYKGKKIDHEFNGEGYYDYDKPY